MSKDPYFKSKKISQWRTVFGLILRPNETYDEIYDKVMNATNCELCQVNLIDGTKSNSRCMDHDHITGYFRMVLCRKCNSGHKRALQSNNTTGIKGVGQRSDDKRWIYRRRKDPLITSKHKFLVLWFKFVYETTIDKRT